MNVNEHEHMLAQIYNLTLYLHYIEQNHPEVFAQLNDHFEGLPGYSSIILE
ncbi:MAG: hypothetical protein IJ418_16425 [Clostridia bacterium]|nr:hypothetical protein [Clostridia bacterium]